MSLKIVLLFYVVVIATLSSVDGQYICQMDGLIGQKVSRRLPGSLNTDTCTGSVTHNCVGEMSESYIQCKCINATLNKVPPGVDCWTAGDSLKNSEGYCNSHIPNGTAIADFDANGNFISGFGGAFMGCKNSTTIQMLGQTCSSGLRIFLLTKGSLVFDVIRVVKAKDLVSPNLVNKFDCSQTSPSLQKYCSLDIGFDICQP